MKERTLVYGSLPFLLFSVFFVLLYSFHNLLEAQIQLTSTPAILFLILVDNHVSSCYVYKPRMITKETGDKARINKMGDLI